MHITTCGLNPSRADPSAPVLNQFHPILQELVEYRNKGGGTILDCQPGGCGRDGNRLLALSNESGVHLIACTGFHRKKYYPPNYWLWEAGAQKVCDFLCSELEQGLVETLEHLRRSRQVLSRLPWRLPGQTALGQPWKAQPLPLIEPKHWLRSIQKKALWQRKHSDFSRI